MRSWSWLLNFLKGDLRVKLAGIIVGKLKFKQPKLYQFRRTFQALLSPTRYDSTDAKKELQKLMIKLCKEVDINYPFFTYLV